MGGESVTCSKNLSYRPKGNEEKKVDRVGHDAEHVPKNGLESVPEIHGVFREGCLREFSESSQRVLTRWSINWAIRMPMRKAHE